MQITIALIEFLLVGSVSLAASVLIVVNSKIPGGLCFSIPKTFDSSAILALGLLAYLVGAILNRPFDLLTDAVRALVAASSERIGWGRPDWLEGRISERALQVRLQLGSNPDVASRLDYVAFLLRVYRSSVWAFALLSVGLFLSSECFPVQISKAPGLLAIVLSALSLLGYFYERYRLFRWMASTREMRGR